MSEKVVLPNFDLPRDSTRVAMRVLWVMGGVVVVATLVLGVAMWHHRSLEIATAQEAAAKAEAARRAAMAPPPAPAPKVVEKTTAPGGSATTLANVAAGSAPGSASAPAGADSERPAARPHSRRSAKAGRGHGMRGAALLEKLDGKGAKATASKPAKPAGGHAKADDDFIDSLLKK
jgi:hypothetical protein